ncbi:MAG: ABCB family ABC transporter ATP-binding protein/permease [Allosphingosinicella sp.]|uniref:ABCB family ABC transporter ATP-binding protein/permease n=1 Tax=Allosphingosinicella sp. TaxID=2823234 RepID=UPI003926F6DF
MPPHAPRDQSDKQADLQTLRRFVPYLWPSDAPGLRARIVAAFGFVILSKLVQVYGAPFALQGAIDRMAEGSRELAWLVIALAVGYAAARFGTVLFDNLRNTVFEKVGQEAARRLTSNVFGHLHKLSLRFHLERRTGAVTKVVERGTKSIDTMLYFLLFNIAPTILELTLVLIIFGLRFGAWLVIATILMVAVYITFTRIITDWRAKLREQMNEADTGAVAHAVDSLLNFETVKYFTAEERESARYDAAVRAYANAATKSENSLAWLNIGQSVITNVMLAFGMGLVVWGWASGRFTPGDVVLVSTLLTQLFRPLDMLGMVYRTIRQGLIDMAAMFDLIDTPAEITDAPDAGELIVTSGHVRFENVRFGYDPEREILHGIDIDVPAGSTVAVVGPSGAGKSTLSRLLFRFYDPTGGRITIDGQDISKVTQNSLRRAIGIVPQDSVLFNDTVGYNIAYGRDGATQEEVEAAARGAAIHDFIASMPDGYATRVGERGLKLSGGEKQRVAIARTLLKDPPILILDEATSALDSRTEAAIQDTIRTIERGRTSIVIAHRLSTIVDADQIVVLDSGRVAERGTHAQLLRKGGLYAEMWARQQSERDEAEAEAAE